MDIPAHLFVIGLAVVFLLFICVSGTENAIPMYVRERFDDTCNAYLSQIERDGGLNDAAKASLAAELNNIGIINVSVTAPVHGNWGDNATLHVEGDYVFQTTDYSNLSKNSKTKRIQYNMNTRIVCLD